ncbi:MAG: hypothetical protein AABY00_01955 [Nanoarchaeota archaeon]
MYYTSSVHSLEGLVKAAGLAGGISFCMGWPSSYLADAFLDLAGIEPSPRLPRKVQDLSRKAKKSLAALVTAGGIAATALVYQFTPDYSRKVENAHENQRTSEIDYMSGRSYSQERTNIQFKTPKYTIHAK